MFKIRFRPITHSPCSQGPAWISLLSVQIPALTTSATILTHAGCRIRTRQAEPSFPGSHSCSKLQGLAPPRNFWRISEFIYKQEMLYPELLVYSTNRAPFPSHILTLEISFTVSWSLIIRDLLLSRGWHFPLVLSMLQVSTCHSGFKADLSMGMLKKGTWYNKCNR